MLLFAYLIFAVGLNCKIFPTHGKKAKFNMWHHISRESLFGIVMRGELGPTDEGSLLLNESYSPGKMYHYMDHFSGTLECNHYII